MATPAVEGQFDDASPPPSPHPAPPPDPVAAPAAVALDAPTPWGALRTALPPANVGKAPGAPASALAIVNALSTEQVAALVAARRAAAGGVDATAGDAGVYSASDEDSDTSAGDGGATGGGVLGGLAGGDRGSGVPPPPADDEDGDGDGMVEPPEPCLGLLDTRTDASVGAALTRARETYGLDLLTALRGVAGYDRVRAVNWLRARVVREGGEAAAVAAAFQQKVAEGGGWGGTPSSCPSWRATPSLPRCSALRRWKQRRGQGGAEHVRRWRPRCGPCGRAGTVGAIAALVASTSTYASHDTGRTLGKGRGTKWATHPIIKLNISDKEKT